MPFKILYVLALFMFAFFVFSCKEDDPDLCAKNIDYNDSDSVGVDDFGIFLAFFDDRDDRADLNCDGKFDELDSDIFAKFLGK